MRSRLLDARSQLGRLVAIPDGTGTTPQRRLTILTKYAKNAMSIGHKFRAALCLPPNPGRFQGVPKGRVHSLARLS
jgi:hypothetical protein